MKFKVGDIVKIISDDFGENGEIAKITRYQSNEPEGYAVDTKKQKGLFYYPHELRKLTKLEKAMR